MFNLSEIMKDAWARFRFIRSEYKLQIKRGIVDGSFARALRLAWEAAKEAAADAGREIALATGPNAARAAAIRHELDGLTYQTLRYDTATMRRTLTNELRALA